MNTILDEKSGEVPTPVSARDWPLDASNTYISEEDADQAFEELKLLCEQADPEDHARLTAALAEQKRIGKEQMRIAMGLPQ